jgi:hypothetical protein
MSVSVSTDRFRTLWEHPRKRNSTEQGQNINQQLENVTTSLHQCFYASVIQTFTLTEHMKHIFKIWLHQLRHAHIQPVCEKLHAHSTSFDNPLAGDAEIEKQHPSTWISNSDETFNQSWASYK